ncbi:hypothetical protein SARC_09879 [Sphaeroforma arctica JP610]|uniref:Protein BIG1 n=1 Tax=Sphaeroforma arctica JP610 TaxID=667725 RepID=A0A0L0FME9_9EUKA|nr:hypothetical protein SARC_09879 [Sphaeroforma arctica JP610]KNC77666.1 hypothetical protein SARC_09879 [Sphaeroforma arctica JP610]|eukprot:XP_014151568.1 hypothetical protein SARC_09879 [Sphaeroforma arctica JP610]
MFKALVLAVASVCAVQASGSVPVFVWSPESLAPAVSSGFAPSATEIANQITTSKAEEDKTIVVFLQDKLSNFDFSRYAGSDGVSSPLLQSLLHNTNSHVYDNVLDAADIVRHTVTKTADRTHEIESVAELDILDLGDGVHTILVKLSSPATTGAANQFAVNDKLIGDVMEKIARATNDKYVAVLTASEPSEYLDLNFVHKLSTVKHRRQAEEGDADPSEGGAKAIDPATVQNRYFSAPIITGLFVLAIFTFLIYFGSYTLCEMQSPIRFQDPSIPLVGKEE